jgi:hypothetical protein
MAVVAGWFGGELVDRLAVGVDEGANLNAPSSLSSEEIDKSDASRYGGYGNAVFCREAVDCENALLLVSSIE